MFREIDGICTHSLGYRFKPELLVGDVLHEYTYIRIYTYVIAVSRLFDGQEVESPLI